MSMEHNAIGELIWAVLAEREMSQYELSRRTNLGTDTINRVVNGRRWPTEPQLFRIWVALHTPREERMVLNRYLEAAEYYTVSEEDTENGPGILLPRG